MIDVLNEDDDTAADAYLQELGKLSITPIRDNPMDTNCTVVKDTKKYENGPDKVRAVGDPYKLYERNECFSNK